MPTFPFSAGAGARNRLRMKSPGPTSFFVAVAVALLGATFGACADDGPRSPGASDIGSVDVETADALVDADAGADAGADASGCLNPGTDGATAGCLEPTMAPEYYVEQALKYFDTLDTSASEDSIPEYSELVARWEWPPWLLLTGYGRDDMIRISLGLRDADPSTVPERDCRFFDEQPFARCRVVFEYEEGPCPIYEEFVFNDAGEMTFIEAWSDLPGMLPMDDAEADPWGEGADVRRLSTRIPGLGNATGTIDPDGEHMAAAAEADAEVADFVERARDFWGTWFAELSSAEPDFFARGCGWETGTSEEQ